MKFKNKILSCLLAVVIAFGVIGLPIMGIAKTLAEEYTVWSNEILVIKKVNKSYDVAVNNFLNFSDYCDNLNVEVKVFKPDGTLSAKTAEGVYFKTPGLYAVQFSLNSNITIYADPIYIPVSTNGVEEIELNGKLNSVVKAGTRVEIPDVINGEGKDISIQVYTPYGTKVDILTSGETGKKTFTNITDVLGTYFVEYSKTVSVGNSSEVMYKYQTIEFSNTSTNTVSTVYNEKSNLETATGKVQINISKTGLSGDDTNLYLYKYYDVAGAYVTMEDGTTAPNAQINLTILDTETSKFYNFNTQEFDISNLDEAKIELGENTDDFILRSFENLKNDHGDKSFSFSGHTLKFHFTATVDGEPVEEITVEKTEKFDTSKISIQSDGLVPSEVTNMVKVETVEDNTLSISNVDFPGVKVIVEDGYDLDGIIGLITSVKLQITPEGQDIITSANEREDTKVGIDSIGTGLNKSFVFYYNQNIDADQKKWKVQYFIELTDGEEEGRSATISQEYTTYARTSSEDKTAPSKITIGSYSVISTNGTIVVPTATAEDKDDNGILTNGVQFEVILTGEGKNEIVSFGETINGLADGNYTIKFKAVDANGNSRAKFIGIKVINTEENNKVTTEPNLYVYNASYTRLEDGHYTVNVDTDADSVTVFGGEQGQFSPTKIKYNNGTVSQFEFDCKSRCIAILSRSNSYATSYIAIKFEDSGFGINKNMIKSLGYQTITDGYTLITPNTTIEGNVFNKFIWFGSSDFTIEAPENAFYSIDDDNIFTFYTAGNYTITSTENIEVDGETTGVKAITTLTIKNGNTILLTSQPYGNKLVADKGESFVLNFPVVTNYFGYEVDYIIKDSTGKKVENSVVNDGNKITFTAPKKDVYTIQYTFTGDNIEKSIVNVTIPTGNIASPKITLGGANENVVWSGDVIKYNIKGASAIDKNGKACNVAVSCFDQYGKQLIVTTEGENLYVDLKGAGFYTIRYTAIDEDGLLNVVESVFAVEFPEEDTSNKLSAWQVIGLVFGIMVGACAIALIIIFSIKYNKNKNRFINKAKKEKKQEKKDQLERTSVYTIAESKDEKHWIVKNGNKTIVKASSKAEAIEKAKENHKKGQLTIKVYNKNGRLIDSI